MKLNLLKYALLSLPLLVASCSDENTELDYDLDEKPYANYPEDFFTGGKLGTVYNISAIAYKQPAPAIDKQGLTQAFQMGESFFDHPFTQFEKPMSGLGPLYIRKSCRHCHIGYGHGKRQTKYDSDTFGNGYILMITDENDIVVQSFGWVAMGKATEPFKPQFDESKVVIDWRNYTDQWGNKFDDGETYSLIYPEVTLKDGCIYGKLIDKWGNEVPMSRAKVRLESTIGFIGSGLLDAIPDDSIMKQYRDEAASPYVVLNPQFWDNNAKDFTKRDDGTPWIKSPEGIVYKFDYALDRASVMSDASFWEVQNVTRKDFRKHYIPTEYWQFAAADPDVTSKFYQYYPEWNLTGDPAKDIITFGNCDTLAVEMQESDYINYMVWHRGVGIPAARNTKTDDFKEGKRLFNEIGCTSCHRPTWTTGDDKIRDPYNRFTADDKRMVHYPNQKIWPYSDMIQHRLFMKNDLRTGWCKTAPLWGRGLQSLCAGHTDRLHDCRARNTLEAIMWHGCTGEGGTSDAMFAVKKFRALTKEQRELVIKFVDSI